MFQNLNTSFERLLSLCFHREAQLSEQLMLRALLKESGPRWFRSNAYNLLKLVRPSGHMTEGNQHWSASVPSTLSLMFLRKHIWTTATRLRLYLPRCYPYSMRLFLRQKNCPCPQGVLLEGSLKRGFLEVAFSSSFPGNVTSSAF